MANGQFILNNVEQEQFLIQWAKVAIIQIALPDAEIKYKLSTHCFKYWCNKLCMFMK